MYVSVSVMPGGGHAVFLHTKLLVFIGTKVLIINIIQALSLMHENVTEELHRANIGEVLIVINQKNRNIPNSGLWHYITQNCFDN